MPEASASPQVEAELRRLAKEVALLEKEGRRLAAEVRQLHSTRRFLLRRLEKEQRRRQRLRSSLSWRLTRPLRWLGDLFRRSKRSAVPDPAELAPNPARRAQVGRLPDPARHGEQPRSARVAVIVHAFYPELLPEILGSVVEAGFAFDLFVTCPDSALAEVNNHLREFGLESGHVDVVPNRGRDIAPFLKTMREVIARDYSLILKLHTKRSSHRDDGAGWRSSMLAPLLSPAGAAAAIRALREPRGFGVIGPSGHIVSLSDYGGSNLDRVRELAHALGIDRATEGGDAFVAGTMFFARVEAIAPLLRLGFDETDFEPELGQIDGTLAHAIERLTGLSAKLSGYRLGSVEAATGAISEAAPMAEAYPFGQRAAP